MRGLLQTAGSLLLCLSCILPALAQRGGRSRLPDTFRSIRGQVVDAVSNRPLQGAFVMLQDEAGGIFLETRVGANGRFNFETLPLGVFYVAAEMGGYHRAAQRVDLSRQTRAYVPLFLHPKQDRKPLSPPDGEASTPVQSLAIPAEAREAFEKGKEALMEQQDLDTGEQYLREAIRLYPSYLEAHLLLGTCLMDGNKWEEAEQVLAESLQINDRFAPTHFALATLFKQQGKLEEAQQELERGLSTDPDWWQGHREMAQTLLELGNTAEAKIHGERAKEINPEDPLVRVVLGNVLLQTGDLDGASREYRDYLDLAPEGRLRPQVQEKVQEIKRRQRQLALTEKPPLAIAPQARREYQTGQMELSRQNLGRALEHFRRAVEIAPHFVQAQHMVGVVFTQRQEWEQAEAAFRKCFETDDQFAPCYLALGRLYNLQERTGRAVPLLERAVDLAPHNWLGHFELAQALFSQKKISEAEIRARQAHELLPTAATEPDSLLVHVLLGNIGLLRRDLQSARREFQHYLDVAPDGSLAPQLRYKVQHIDVALRQQRRQPSQ